MRCVYIALFSFFDLLAFPAWGVYVRLLRLVTTGRSGSAIKKDWDISPGPLVVLVWSGRVYFP